MSMMTNTLLQNVETKLWQIENDTNEPYHSKLVILVGNHGQLPKYMSLASIRHKKLLPKILCL
jgi:hypothetical protein